MQLFKSISLALGLLSALLGANSALAATDPPPKPAIAEYREKHGNFTAPEQLLEIQGIGKATLEKNKDRIVF